MINVDVANLLGFGNGSAQLIFSKEQCDRGGQYRAKGITKVLYIYHINKVKG